MENTENNENNESIAQADACYDVPDERDWDSSVFELAGAETPKVPHEFVMNRTTIYNQNAQKETYYACTIYGMTHVTNEQNALEGHVAGVPVPEEDPLLLTRKITSEPNTGFQPSFGWSLQAALNWFKDNGFISGYYKVVTAEEIKGAMARGHLVYTGWNKFDWNATAANGWVAKWGKSFGHCMMFDRYSDGKQMLGLRNSLGPNACDNGIVWVKYGELGNLFTRYAVIDNLSYHVLAWKKATDKGIVDGSRPNDPITRNELATILKRVSGKTVWNGSRPNDLPTVNEKALMGNRAFRRAFKGMTRIDAVAYAMPSYHGITYPS